MSARRNPIDDPEADDGVRLAIDNDLHRRVLRDMIARPDAYDDMPRGSTLTLVPDDDPAQAEWAIRRGAAAARRGANVYLRRTVVADLPEVVSIPLDEPIGSRRIEYAQDGEVQKVVVKGGDGAWHEVEPTPEDAAGLPPRGD